MCAILTTYCLLLQNTLQNTYCRITGTYCSTASGTATAHFQISVSSWSLFNLRYMCSCTTDVCTILTTHCLFAQHTYCAITTNYPSTAGGTATAHFLVLASSWKLHVWLCMRKPKHTFTASVSMTCVSLFLQHADSCRVC